MADAFISYAQGNREWVAKFASALEGEGFSVWWDPNILPGTRFREIVKTELAQAHVVIVVWSHLSVGSDWVIGEADEGRTMGKLLPVLMENVRPPHEFRSIQTADLSQWRGRRESPDFQLVVSGIRSKVGRTKPLGEKDSAPPQSLPNAVADADAPASSVPGRPRFWLLYPFHGRLTRLGYLFLTLLGIALAAGYVAAIFALTQPSYQYTNAINWSLAIGAVPFAIFWLSLQFRRMHDIGLSGLWFIPALVLPAIPHGLVLVPWLNFVLFGAVLLALALVPGASGPNRFGAAAPMPRLLRRLNFRLTYVFVFTLACEVIAYTMIYSFQRGLLFYVLLTTLFPPMEAFRRAYAYEYGGQWSLIAILVAYAGLVAPIFVYLQYFLGRWRRLSEWPRSQTITGRVLRPVVTLGLSFAAYALIVALVGPLIFHLLNFW